MKQTTFGCPESLREKMVRDKRFKEKYEKKLQKFLLFSKINILKYFLFLNSIEKPAFVIEDVNN